MYQPILPDEFDDLVNKHYKFLEESFSFSLNKISNYSYIAESENTKIYIYLEHAVNLVIEIEATGNGAKQIRSQNLLPERISIVTISKCYDPELQYEVEMLDKEKFISNVPVELERRVILLKKYCKKLLMGDYSDWVKIEMYSRSPRR